MTTLSTLDIFKEAKDLLEQNGWVKHACITAQGEHSLEGAVICATGELLHRQGLLPGSEEWCKIAETYDDKALGALREIVGPRLNDWHSHPDRTFEEVLGVLDQAIEKTEG